MKVLNTLEKYCCIFYRNNIFRIYTRILIENVCCFPSKSGDNKSHLVWIQFFNFVDKEKDFETTIWTINVHFRLNNRLHRQMSGIVIGSDVRAYFCQHIHWTLWEKIRSQYQDSLPWSRMTKVPFSSSTLWTALILPWILRVGTYGGRKRPGLFFRQMQSSEKRLILRITERCTSNAMFLCKQKEHVLDLCLGDVNKTQKMVLFSELFLKLHSRVTSQNRPDEALGANFPPFLFFSQIEKMKFSLCTLSSSKHAEKFPIH